MRLETLRCCVAGVSDPTIGIAAMLSAFTLESGDTLPATPTIYNDDEHEWVAAGALPQNADGVTLPALVVVVKGYEPDPEVQTVVRDGRVSIAYAWLQRSTDAKTMNRHAAIVNRCLLRHLSRFMANGNAAMRTRNEIGVCATLELSQPDVLADWNGAVCSAVTEVTFDVREFAP